MSFVPVGASRWAAALLVALTLALAPGSARGAAARPAATVAAPAVAAAPILMYHFIRTAPATDVTGFHLSVPPPTFARQMALLSLTGHHTATLDAVLDAADGGSPLPRNAVVLTFDDGYDNFAFNATPIMRALGFSGTDYVVPGFTGLPGYMSRDQLSAVVRQGMTIGAHTMLHRDLAGMTDAEASDAIGRSRSVLQQWTGQPVATFAYPYGSFNVRTPGLVAAAGFRGGVTTRPGVDESRAVRMTMPRVRVDGADDLPTFAAKLGIPLPGPSDTNFWAALEQLTATALHGATVGLIGAPAGDGYRLVDRGGLVRSFGSAVDRGSVTGELNRTVVGGASTPSGAGYWLVAGDGGVFPFGDAGGYGSTGNLRLNRPVVGMATTPGGHGYWLVASDGGIFPFGDAGGFGSTGGIRLNLPVVGMAATPSGHGYWLVAADGGIFPFGDAGGFGSTGGIRLNRPVVGMAATPTGKGYWLVASDGGIFPFGDAGGFGSTGGVRLNAPIVAMAVARRGAGYWLAAADGGIFPFGDAPGYGSGAI